MGESEEEFMTNNDTKKTMETDSKEEPKKPIASNLIIKPEPPRHKLIDNVEHWLRDLQKKKKIKRLDMYLEVI